MLMYLNLQNSLTMTTATEVIKIKSIIDQLINIMLEIIAFEHNPLTSVSKKTCHSWETPLIK